MVSCQVLDILDNNTNTMMTRVHPTSSHQQFVNLLIPRNIQAKCELHHGGGSAMHHSSSGHGGGGGVGGGGSRLGGVASGVDSGGRVLEVNER